MIKLIATGLWICLVTAVSSYAAAMWQTQTPPEAEVDKLLAGSDKSAPADADDAKPLRIMLVDGKKDHGKGEHDYPAWKKEGADRGRLFRTDDVRGVRVHRCWHYVPSKVSALKRILHEGTFVATSFLRQLPLPANACEGGPVTRGNEPQLLRIPTIHEMQTV